MLLSTFGLCTAIIGVGAAARAEPPTQEDFRIRYLRAIEQKRSNDTYEPTFESMTAQDLERHVNRARCVCGDEIRIEIERAGSKPIDNGLLEVWVGEACEESKKASNVIYGECQTRHAYQTGAAGEWIQDVPPQRFEVSAFANPTPRAVENPAWIFTDVEAACNGSQGSGGVWVCSGNKNCIDGKFFINGDWNENSSLGTPSGGGEEGESQAGDGGGGGEGGIVYDFRGPVSPPTNIVVKGGEESVTLEWNVGTVSDVAGYRVLCAKADGSAVHSVIGDDKPPAAYINRGDIYHTAHMYCGASQVGGIPVVPDDEQDDPAEGGATNNDTTTGTETNSATATAGITDSGGTGGESGTGGYAPFAYGDDTGDDLLDESDDGGVPQDSGDDATDGDEDLRETNPWEYEKKTGIEGLDWKYICSEKIDAKSTSIRIDGLDNDENYKFVLVAYDRSGNPTASSVIEGQPVRSDNLWDICNANPDLYCGEACAMGANRGSLGLGLSVLALLSFGAMRKRHGRRSGR